MTYRSRDGKAPLCATFQTFGCSIVDLLELPEKNNHSGQDIKSELLERIQGNTGVSESKDEATSTIKVADTTNKVKKCDNNGVNAKEEEKSNLTRYRRERKHHRMLQHLTHDHFTDSHIFTSYLHSGLLQEYVADHVLHDQIVVPGAALLEASCAAALLTEPRLQASTSALSLDTTVLVEDMVVHEPLVAADAREDQAPPTRVWCLREADDSVRVYSEDAGEDGSRVLHSEAIVSLVAPGSSDAPDWAAAATAVKDD